ncbi:MAG: type I restriction enzyme HsdR N-terminal domain-containing protein [Rhodospirillales bacterium]|nr:type I restriction enzyme HsdR N-terminal domain-containing protein [Rhodospirillales bacterium]
MSKKVAKRISKKLKRYRSILSDAKTRDISESDTVTILVEMLADLFGYDKFTEITKEFEIRSTYCDLAVKVGSDVRYLIEAKAIGVALKENHIKQAVDYASNKGIDWVVLTNGVVWQVYKVHFKKPVDKSLVCEIDILTANPRDPHVIECLANLTREGFTPSSMDTFYQRQQVTSRFALASLLLTEKVLKTVRRELRKVAPKLKIDIRALEETIRDEVLKREVVESDEAKQAAKFIRRASKAASKAKMKKIGIISTSHQAQNSADSHDSQQLDSSNSQPKC